MRFRNTAIFLTLIFFATITRNISAQEQPDTQEQPETTPEQPDTDEQTDIPLYFLNFQPLPGINIFGGNFKKTTNVFLFGTIVGYGYNLSGVGSAPIGIINSGQVHGVQLSGIFNFANEGMDGLQTSSIFNVAKVNVRGVQLAGISNYASGSFKGIQLSGIVNRVEGDMWGLQLAPINFRGEGDGIGLQVGLINSSDSGYVIPIGLINKVKDGMKHFWVFTDDMLFLNAGYRSGSKIFYSHSNIGIGGALLSGKDGDKLIINRSGFGIEIPLRKFFIDIDISTGNIFKVEEIKDIWQLFFGTNTDIYQLRFIGGYKMYERLGVFAGISFDYINKRKDTAPSPEDFAGKAPGKSFDNKAYKVGLFGGIQF